MKNLFTLLLIFSAPVLPAQTVKVVAKVPFYTPSDARIYVTGDHKDLGKWKANAIAMTLLHPSVYEVTLDLPEAVKEVQLKVTRGTWKSEAADEHGYPFYNYSVDLTRGPKVAVFDIPQWADLPRPKPPGSYTFYPRFWSPELENFRTIRVWLPPNYEKDKKKRFPVLYMHDGQYLDELAVGDVLTELIRKNEVRSAIVVGMDNTFDRTNEYDFTVSGKAYADFVADTVKPFIDRTYRTSPGRESTYVMGVSFGAGISVAMVWNRRDVFSRAAGLSFASMQDEEYPKFVLPPPNPPEPFKIYIDHGDFDGDVGYDVWTRPCYEHLLAQGMSASNLDYQVFPFGNHHEWDWSRRLHLPLKFLLAD